jgi:DNA-binding transcriptional ArsR family regulator
VYLPSAVGRPPTMPDGMLRYPSSHSARLDLAGRPLALVPVVCSPNGILTNEAHPEAVRLGYTAPGFGELWGAEPADPHRQLASLLGASRAQLLSGLRTPASTTDLAQRFRFAPSTVSHHLSGLADAGLVEASRVGHFVLYRASWRGGRLLELFDQSC